MAEPAKEPAAKPAKAPAAAPAKAADAPAKAADAPAKAEDEKTAKPAAKKEAPAANTTGASNATKPAEAETPKPVASKEINFNEDSWDTLDEDDLAAKKNLYEVAVSKQQGQYEPFNDPHDFHGYNIRDNKEQMSHVKVLANKPHKAGRRCQPFDFFTVQYKAFMEEGNKMMKVLDSKKANEGKPVTFQQGQYNVVKCWDLAAPLLNQGEKISISCPAYLSNGGREEYSHMGSKKIPSNTPLTYELEVLECEDSIDKINDKSKKHGVHLNKHYHKKAHHLIHSKLKPWDGDNTHDLNGLIKRTGGGPPKDWVGEIDRTTNKIKPDVESLKKIVEIKEKKV